MQYNKPPLVHTSHKKTTKCEKISFRRLAKTLQLLCVLLLYIHAKKHMVFVKRYKDNSNCNIMLQKLAF